MSTGRARKLSHHLRGVLRTAPPKHLSYSLAFYNASVLFLFFVLFLPSLFYFKVKALFIIILFGTILLLLFQHVFHLAPPQVSICNHLFVKEIFCLFMSGSKTLKKT